MGVLVVVTGGTGVLGSRVAGILRDRGHQVRAVSRRSGDLRVDVTTAEGLPQALEGADAVVHCATSSTRPDQVDLTGTRRLVEAARRAGVRHLVYPGIVGSDVIPLRYYRAKTASEDLVAGSGLGWTILRSTQFHQLLWKGLELLARLPVMVVPGNTRFQPIDPMVVARLLADAVEAGPRGRMPDVGGRYIYTTRDLARSYLGATGRRRLVMAVDYPGLGAAAFRAGANLTPNRDSEGETWNQFVARQVAAQ